MSIINGGVEQQGACAPVLIENTKMSTKLILQNADKEKYMKIYLYILCTMCILSLHTERKMKGYVVCLSGLEFSSQLSSRKRKLLTLIGTKSSVYFVKCNTEGSKIILNKKLLFII